MLRGIEEDGALRDRKSDNWRIASKGGEVAPRKGKPTAVIQTEDIKSIAIELEQFIITTPPKKKTTATRKFTTVTSC